NITAQRLAAHAILDLDRSGSMDPDYYAGTPLDIMLVTDVSGSMDPDYYNAFWGIESIVEEGFTPYYYQKSGSVPAHGWWNDTFTLQEDINDLKILLNNNQLKLQIISPSGKIYGYNGGGNNSPSYMYSDNMPWWYWDTPLHEWVWHKPYSYPDSRSYSYSADTDFPEKGTWIVKVYNPTTSTKSFQINSYIEKLSAVKTASKNFITNLISNDRVGLVSFGGVKFTGTPRISISDLTYDVNSINSNIDTMYASGGTPTGDAIKNVRDSLLANQRGGARPYIVLLSDGMPTVGSGWVSGRYYSDPVDYAIACAQEAKNTIINGYNITIYTIGFGTDADHETMKSIATDPSNYYYAANTSQLQSIYYNIAQQISDFDLTERNYGVQGFTPFQYSVSNISITTTWNDSFIINSTINDFKLEIESDNISALNFTLISPSGKIYPDLSKQGYVNRTGYYYYGNKKYIWINPVNGQYPDADMDTLEQGKWNLTVTGIGEFNITTYIDKKSAAKIASFSFLSSLDPIQGDRVGLVSYSYNST
ncbi:MAG TPA: VWA domain-containing protein, partial [Archaeoglobaceae archaeon]|nr:VWA domain-containing protein [Archaeoglobaceae archaeon]